MTSPRHVGAAATNPRELRIRPYSVDQDRCIVALTGEVDLASAPDLKAALAELYEVGYTRFVLDLSGVSYLDSTGVGVLVGLQNRLEEHDRLSLAAVPPAVAHLLSVVGLDVRIPSFPTVEAALAETGGDRQRSPMPLELPQAALRPPSADQPTAEARRAGPAIGNDAELVLGLASTALPFAGSELAEAERWLRILRRYGEAGRMLRESGVQEVPLVDPAADEPRAPESFAAGAGEDRLEAVSRQAERVAGDRGAATVGTVELLQAVMATYGPAFDRALAAYGGRREDLELALGA